MGWVRIEDGFAWHPKVLQAGPLAMAMYVAGLCYANRYLTDGFIPKEAVPSLIPLQGLSVQLSQGELVDIHEDVTHDMVVQALLEAGLWEEVDGGYQIHDYLKYQPSRGAVLREREKARQRMARARSAAGIDDGSREVPNNTDRSSGEVRANMARSSDEVPENVAGSSADPNPNPNKITPPPSRESDLERASDHVPASPLPSREGESRPAASEEAIRLSAEYMDDPKFRPSERHDKRTLARRSDWAITDFDEALQQGIPAELIRQAMQLAAPGSSPRQIVAKARVLWEKQHQQQPPARASPPVKLRIFRPKDPDQEANAA